MINHASQDGRVCNHPGLTKYGIESYIAVPLSRRDGTYFGTLCALDPAPAQLDETSFTVFELLAQLIAFELEADDEREAREKHIRALNDIISIAAHDLRQPLSALLMRGQLAARQAEREAVSPKLITSLQAQMAATRQAIALTDRLLDVSRLEVNSFSLEIAEVNLAELIEQVVSDVKTTSPDYSFETQFAPNLKVQGDVTRLNQVIRNLLDNAVKYSPFSKEAIQITATIVADPTDLQRSHILVKIEDRGLGVKATDLPHLFERQFRTQEAQDAGISGSGFGLYISRQLIEAHGGSIWAESAVGNGLTIIFTLPVEA